MKIYLFIHEDHHTDVQVTPYISKETAIVKARELARDSCGGEFEYYEEESIDGWLFYASYSCESDSVRVIESELME